MGPHKEAEGLLNSRLTLLVEHTAESKTCKNMSGLVAFFSIGKHNIPTVEPGDLSFIQLLPRRITSLCQ